MVIFVENKQKFCGNDVWSKSGSGGWCLYFEFVLKKHEEDKTDAPSNTDKHIEMRHVTFGQQPFNKRINSELLLLSFNNTLSSLVQVGEEGLRQFSWTKSQFFQKDNVKHTINLFIKRAVIH